LVTWAFLHGYVASLPNFVQISSFNKEILAFYKIQILHHLPYLICSGELLDDSQRPIHGYCFWSSDSVDNSFYSYAVGAVAAFSVFCVCAFVLMAYISLLLLVGWLEG